MSLFDIPSWFESEWIKRSRSAELDDLLSDVSTFNLSNPSMKLTLPQNSSSRFFVEEIFISAKIHHQAKSFKPPKLLFLLFSQRMRNKKFSPFFIENAAFLFVCNEVSVKLWSILSWIPLTKHVDGITELMNLKLFLSFDSNFWNIQLIFFFPFKYFQILNCWTKWQGGGKFLRNPTGWDYMCGWFFSSSNFQ